MTKKELGERLQSVGASVDIFIQIEDSLGRPILYPIQEIQCGLDKFGSPQVVRLIPGNRD